MAISAAPRAEVQVLQSLALAAVGNSIVELGAHAGGVLVMLAHTAGQTPVVLLLDTGSSNRWQSLDVCADRVVPFVVERLLAPAGIDERRVLWMGCDAECRFDRLHPFWDELRNGRVPVTCSPLAPGDRSLGAFAALGAAARLALNNGLSPEWQRPPKPQGLALPFRRTSRQSERLRAAIAR